MEKKINHTSVISLLLDDDFVDWYHDANGKQAQAWNEWMAENPLHKTMAAEAFCLLECILSGKKTIVTDEKTGEACNHLLMAISGKKCRYYNQ